MILTKNSFRILKNALSKVPGAPGSAKLGEIMARGFGFPDYHALKTHLEAIEASLDWQPDLTTLDYESLEAATEGMDAQERADFHATFFALWVGDIFFEDLDSYPEIILGDENGRVMLLDTLPQAYVDAAEAYYKEACRIFGGVVDFRFTIPAGDQIWLAVEPVDLYGTLEATVDRGDGAITQIHASELLQPLPTPWEHNTDPNIFAESLFYRVRNSFTEAPKKQFQCLRITEEGIYAEIQKEDPHEYEGEVAPESPLKIVFAQWQAGLPSAANRLN